MKTKLFIILAVCFSALSSCDLFDDSPCGPKEKYDLYLLGSSIVDSTSGVYYSYTEGNNRVFQWSKIVEKVCAQEHVKADCRIALLDETTTGISARGRIDWQFLFESKIPMTKS